MNQHELTGLLQEFQTAAAGKSQSGKQNICGTVRWWATILHLHAASCLGNERNKHLDIKWTLKKTVDAIWSLYFLDLLEPHIKSSLSQSFQVGTFTIFIKDSIRSLSGMIFDFPTWSQLFSNDSKFPYPHPALSLQGTKTHNYFTFNHSSCNWPYTIITVHEETPPWIP